MAINLYVIFAVTPMVPEQHWAQKIFYVHVPIAWSGFMSYFIVMVSGLMFLLKKDSKWDHVGLAAAELGTMFVVLVLITGPIWATPIWGKPWIWEPRLTTTLILFLIYVGYFYAQEIWWASRTCRSHRCCNWNYCLSRCTVNFLFCKIMDTPISTSSSSGNESTTGRNIISIFIFNDDFYLPVDINDSNKISDTKLQTKITH